MVKVLRVITRLNIGGPAQHVIFLTAYLDGQKWDSGLVTGLVDPHEGDMSDLAVAHGIVPVVIDTLRNGAGIVADLRSFVRLYHLFRRERPSIVHLHLFKARMLGGLAARLAGVPVVVETLHGTLFAQYFHSALSWLLLWAERFLGRLVDAIITVSEEVAREVVRLRVATPAKVHVIPLGLELERFREILMGGGALRDELRVPTSAPLVGFVGRLVPIKGCGYFVDAAAQILRAVPKARFVIIGDGPQRLALEAQVSRFGLKERVRFLGWRRDLEHLYPDLDVVVLSSVNEGTPVSVIEAMAAGRPVVATRVGGVPDVIEDGVNGLLVPPKDASALADAVVSLLREPARGQQLGSAARQAVYPRFSIVRLVQDIEALYLTLLEHRGLSVESAR